MTAAETESPVIVSYPELEILDELIVGLEALITEADETPLAIGLDEPPKRAFYRIVAAGAMDRKPKAGEAFFLDGDKLMLRCDKTEVVKLTPLEVTIQAEKSGRGESLAIVVGKAQNTKRVRGGYEIDIEVVETRKTRITPGQKLRECLTKNDVQGWNRWCQDIRDTIELQGIDLRNADLAGYDLCCSNLDGVDLSGANLTGTVLAGADLSQCKMDNVTISGTDFFRARMNRAQAKLLALSGMPEVESVLFDS